MSISPFYTSDPDSSLTRLRDRNSDLYKTSQTYKSGDQSLTRLRHRFYLAGFSCFESNVVGWNTAFIIDWFIESYGFVREFVCLQLSVRGVQLIKHVGYVVKPSVHKPLKPFLHYVTTFFHNIAVSYLFHLV